MPSRTKLPSDDPETSNDSEDSTSKSNREMDMLEDSRISCEKADYMELTGAKKDGDCRKVNVKGGISKERGCCNIFEAKNAKVTSFKCGTCEYVKDGVPNGEEQ